MVEEPIVTISASQAVANRLRDMLRQGKLKPGSQVVEERLAEWCNVSRSTARTAIEVLVASGILTRKPNRSAYVRRYTLDDIDEIQLLISIMLDAANPGEKSLPISPARVKKAVDATQSPRIKRILAGLLVEYELALNQTRSSP